MTKNDALKIIDDNFTPSKSSLVYGLHVDKSFDINSFWSLFNSISTLCNLEKKSLPEDLNMKIVHIYGYALRSFIHHLEENDSYTLSEAPHNLGQYCEVLRTPIELFYQNKNSSYLGPIDFNDWF